MLDLTPLQRVRNFSNVHLPDVCLEMYVISCTDPLIHKFRWNIPRQIKLWRDYAIEHARDSFCRKLNRKSSASSRDIKNAGEFNETLLDILWKSAAVRGTREPAWNRYFAAIVCFQIKYSVRDNAGILKQYQTFHSFSFERWPDTFSHRRDTSVYTCEKLEREMKYYYAHIFLQLSRD